MKRVAMAVFLVFAMASLGSARAQAQSRAQKKRAITLIKKGRDAKKMGDRYVKRKSLRKRAMARYKKAALAYIEAYEIVSIPQLVYELAELYDLRGENRWAVRGYRRYLELEPDGQYAATAEERADELGDSEGEPGDEAIEPSTVFGDELEPDLEPDPEPEPDPDPDPDPEPEPDHDPDADPDTEPEPEPDPDTGTAPATKPTKPGRNLRWGGMAAGGAGVLFIGIGIKFGMDASSAADDLSNKEGAWTEEDIQRIKDGDAANKKMLTFTLLGAVSLAAGGALYYLGDRKDKEHDKKAGVAWVPDITPNGATLTLVVRF